MFPRLWTLVTVAVIGVHAMPQVDAPLPEQFRGSESFLQSRAPFGLRAALEAGNSELQARQGCRQGYQSCDDGCMRVGSVCCGYGDGASCRAGTQCFSSGCCQTGFVPCGATDGKGVDGCYPQSSGASCCASRCLLPSDADLLPDDTVLPERIVCRAVDAAGMEGSAVSGIDIAK